MLSFQSDTFRYSKIRQLRICAVLLQGVGAIMLLHNILLFVPLSNVFFLYYSFAPVPLPFYKSSPGIWLVWVASPICLRYILLVSNSTNPHFVYVQENSAFSFWFWIQVSFLFRFSFKVPSILINLYYFTELILHFFLPVRR